MDLRRSLRLIAIANRKKPQLPCELPPRSYLPTVLDCLPLDAIQYEIFPYLDYESRVNLNQCLPLEDRISKKINLAAIVRHDRILRIQTLQKALISLENEAEHTDKRIYKMCNIYEILYSPLYFPVILEQIALRNVVVDKIKEVLSFSTVDQYYSKGALSRIHRVCKKLEKKISSHLFDENLRVDYHSLPMLSFV